MSISTLLRDLIFCCRKQYNCAQDEMVRLGPLNLTKHEFASGIAHQAVERSEHEAINREVQKLSGRIDHAADFVDTLEQQLCIKMQWHQDDTEYVKMCKYISNRKFICIIEELQGLVVSRLVELDKMNLAGSGM